MKLTIIGNYGPYPVSNQNTSCYLVSGKHTTIALDFGSGAIAGVSSKMDITKLDGIVFSHLHYDHISDILPLVYLADINKIKYNVYMPSMDCPQADIINGASGYNVGFIDESKKVTIGEFSLQFLAVNHPIKTYAIKVTDGKSMLVYSGDTTYFSGLKEFCKGSDIALLDCGNGDASAGLHLSLDNAREIASCVRGQVIASHINPNATYSNTVGVTLAKKDMVMEF